MLSQQNSPLRSHLGAKTFFPVTSRTLGLVRTVRTCVPLTFSTGFFFCFFLLEGAVIPFFSSTVFVSSTTGEVYICRSVFGNCVVHLGVFFKGNCQIQCKGSDFCLLFLIVFSYFLCRLLLGYVVFDSHSWFPTLIMPLCLFYFGSFFFL